MDAKQALKMTRSLVGEERIQECNRLMEAPGVEAIRGDWRNRYWCDIVANYVNVGDMYTPTVLWVRSDNRAGERFTVACLGDFVEKNQKRYGII